MRKALIIAAALATGLSGAIVTAPVQADNHASMTTFECSTPIRDVDTDKEAIKLQFERKGIMVEDIAVKDNCYQVTVKQEDGSLDFEYYDPNSLEEVMM